MQSFFRLLAILLALSASGVARAAVELAAVDACADDASADSDCASDCTTACATCIQCPQQSTQIAAPTSCAAPRVVLLVAAESGAASMRGGPAFATDIFHPPRR